MRETTAPPISQLYAITRLESAVGAFHAALSAVAGPRPPSRETIAEFQLQALEAVRQALPYLMLAPQFVERIAEPAMPGMISWEQWMRRNVRGAKPS